MGRWNDPPKPPASLLTPVRAYDPINQRQESATISVASEDGFRRSIRLIGERGRGAILFTRSFVVKAPLLVPYAAGGVRIASSSSVIIRPVGVVDCLFKLEGSAVIDDVTCGDFEDTTNYFKAFVSCRTTANGSPVVTLRRNSVIASRLLTGDDVEGLSGSDYALCEFMDQNAFNRPSGLAGSLGPILAYARRVVANSIDTSAGDAIFLEGNCTIIGNRFLANGVNTGSGTGGNLLAANVGASGGYFSKTLHANDVDLDARTPAAHASSHQSGGSDAIKLDDLATPDDNTDLNASAARHGLLPKLSGSASDVLKGDGTWGSASAGWTIVTKAADQTITSDNTLSDDATLQFAVAASTKYRIRARIFVQSTTAAQFQYSWNGPAAPTLLNIFHTNRTSGSATAGRATAYAVGNNVTMTTGGLFIEFDGILHNGANTGTFAFQWAQRSSDASNTTLNAGSYLEYAVVS